MALGMSALCAVWLLGVWPPPIWWRDHWPRRSAMMRAVTPPPGAGAPLVHPTPLAEISPALQRMLIIGEDSRFWTHHGFDPAEMADALGIEQGRGVWSVARTVWRRRDRMRGASTITQQLAKNLYLSPSRSLLRKVKEGVTAIRLELALPKPRILELYLNVAEWGPGIWGVQAASRSYFGVPPSQLGEGAAAALVATLPHPRSSNPRYQSDRMLARRALILARYHGLNVLVPPEVEESDTTPIVPLEPVPALDSLTVVLPVGDSLADSMTDSVADSLVTDSLRDSTGNPLGDSVDLTP